MKIGRKVFFDVITGNVIRDTGEKQGSVTDTTIEQDIASFTELSERNRETFDVLELPFGAFAQDFAECGGYRVNPTTKELEFAPKPITPDEPLVFDKPLSVQIEELRQRDASMQDDQIFIMEVLATNNLV